MLTKKPLTVPFTVCFMHFRSCFHQRIAFGQLLERAGGSPNFTRRSLGGRIKGIVQVLRRSAYFTSLVFELVCIRGYIIYI